MSGNAEHRAKKQYFRDLCSVAPASERSEQVAQFSELAGHRETCFEDMLSTSLGRWHFSGWLAKSKVRGRAWDLFSDLKAKDGPVARERLLRIRDYASKRGYSVAALRQLLRKENVAFSYLFAGWAVQLLESIDREDHPTPPTNGRTNGHSSSGLQVAEWPAYVACRSRIIESHLRLVPSLVAEFFASFLHDDRVSYLDLIQWGNWGLKEAVDRFAYELGWKFGTFASWRVRAAVQKQLPARLLIRLSSYRAEQTFAADRAAQRFLAEFGREPDAVELGAAIGKTEKAATGLRATFELLDVDSLDRAAGENQKTSLMDTLPSHGVATDSDAIRWLRARGVTALLERLSPREQTVIAMRFGLSPYERDYSLKEIGKKFSISRERVRQIEAEALGKMRNGEKSALLEWLRTGQELR